VVVGPQLHAQRARAHNAFTRCHRAVVAAASVIQRALVAELALIRAISTVVVAITQLVEGQAD